MEKLYDLHADLQQLKTRIDLLNDSSIKQLPTHLESITTLMTNTINAYDQLKKELTARELLDYQQGKIFTLSHTEAKTLLFMADDCICKNLLLNFYETKTIEEIIEETQVEGQFDTDIELEVIVKMKPKKR